MKKRNHFYFFWRALLLPFFKLKYRMKYIGAENVPAEGAYILASNHTHAVDPIIMGMGLKRQVMFMAKEELFKNKFVGWFIRKLDAFPISRGKADTGSIKHFEKVLEEGNLMGIFIEGTRSKDGEFLPPKSRLYFHYGKPLSLEDMGFAKGGAREFRNASRIIMDHIKAIREEDLASAGEKNG